MGMIARNTAGCFSIQCWRFMLSGKPKPVRSYAAFCCPALTLAHLARCAAAIFLRADADMVRSAGAEPVVFVAATIGFDSFPALAHLAFCASAIFRREAADTIRVGRVAFRDAPEPFNDSITEIA
jgi:hypothetical protein